MHYSQFRRRSFSVLQTHYYLPCGSDFELPGKCCASNPTDRDFMYYCHDIFAIPLNRNPPKNTKCTMLRIDSTQTPPGFVRLMIDKNNKDDKPTYFHRPPMLKRIKTNGPSKKSELKYTNTLYYSGVQSQDLVFAIYSPYWPVEAEEWRKRNRFHGWPNEKLIARITRGGCHFVSKLRTWSSCDDTEWRFSFSKAELLLIHSWTDVQKFVYHVIRVIKKDISKSCIDDEQENLQTYYFKTLMFWASEEFPQQFWNEQNINTCVGILLLRFLRCLDEQYCPSYFIPDCNIMTNLRDKEAFANKFQVALNRYGQNKLEIPLSVTGSRAIEAFDCLCASPSWSLFPMNKELNGRFCEYFSEYEWFLPKLKSLHAAIEANLRLMTIDNVISRKKSKDYAACFENLENALRRGNDFISRRNSHVELSSDEIFQEIFTRKQLRNAICIYRRCLNKDDVYDEVLKGSPLHCVAFAYRANMFFTAMESYNESLNEYNTCFDLIRKMETICFNFSPRIMCSLIPILICNSLSRIYDEHLQVILGFATLHRNISSSESPNPSTIHEVCLKLDAWEFLKYLCIQSELKVSMKHMNTIHISYAYSDERQSCMSQLVAKEYYSAAILYAALRQSRAYMKPLTGDLLPHRFRRSEIAEDELLLFY